MTTFFATQVFGSLRWLLSDGMVDQNTHTHETFQACKAPIESSLGLIISFLTIEREFTLQAETSTPGSKYSEHDWWHPNATNVSR
jgi:hypothetical protein